VGQTHSLTRQSPIGGIDLRAIGGRYRSAARSRKQTKQAANERRYNRKVLQYPIANHNLKNGNNKALETKKNNPAHLPLINPPIRPAVNTWDCEDRIVKHGTIAA